MIQTKEDYLRNENSDVAIFDQYESNVRSYCRAFPVVFRKAKGAELWTESGKRYIDFFSGSGALNYGHNHDTIKKKIIEYIESDEIIHALDFFSVAKRSFLTALYEKILVPRGLDYKTQFCAPTGTNAVEAAIKIACKVTGRSGIFSFQGGFHGMTLGALSVTANLYHRKGLGAVLGNNHFIPYCNDLMGSFDSIEYIEKILLDSHSGYEKPAAIIVETVQAEGGIYVAPEEWLQRLRALCTRHDIVMIIDDIQVGCGRTGKFFSFERASIVPDIVTLSKSISGYGLPMAIVLIKPELDKWLPGEHNGTFRGNQLAFIGGATAIELWEEENVEEMVSKSGEYIQTFLTQEILSLDSRIKIRGVGLIWGIDFSGFKGCDIVSKVISECLKKGLLIERVGREGRVLKILPPLITTSELLMEGCEILKNAIVGSIK